MLFIAQKLVGKPVRRSGPPGKLSDLELLTILVYDGLVEQHPTLRGVYDYIKQECDDRFRLPA